MPIPITEPIQDSMWGDLLRHLEEQFPEKLTRLLKQGKLKEYLDKEVTRAWAIEDRMLNANPKVDQTFMSEVVRKEIMPDNPDYLNEKTKPLSPKAQKMLEEFNDEMYLQRISQLQTKQKSPQ